MSQFHLPAGTPGTLSWLSQRTGIPTYNLAMSAAGQPGHLGNQGRYYMAQMMHHRLRAMALAAGQNQAPTA